MPTIEADYLVIGAGAMGMAFADTMATESDASLVIVDRYHRPGGHWNTAYPYVRLHEPSAFYGVNSRKLGSDAIDRVGWNEGLFELATAAGEVCAYFDQVMQQQLLPTGRVSYFPMSEYLGDGRFRTLGGADYTVKIRRRVVTRPTCVLWSPRCGRQPMRSHRRLPASRQTICRSSARRVIDTPSSAPARPASMPVCGCCVRASLQTS